jgi:hypothetical protein
MSRVKGSLPLVASAVDKADGREVRVLILTPWRKFWAFLLSFWVLWSVYLLGWGSSGTPAPVSVLVAFLFGWSIDVLYRFVRGLVDG